MPSRQEQKTAAAQKQCDVWNAKHPVGTRVQYWTGVRRYDGKSADEPPSGDGPTHHAATVLGGHTAVAWPEGAGSCVCLTHVKVIGPPMNDDERQAWLAARAVAKREKLDREIAEKERTLALLASEVEELKARRGA